MHGFEHTTAGPGPASGLVEEGTAFARLAGAATTHPGNGQASGEHRPPLGVERGVERFDVIVIGGGQAGLSVGYHLSRRGLSFVILDGSARIGDPWRQRWDSLRLFTPARYDGLDGMPFPAPPDSFPTKDQMADYLEAYAARFELPVRSGVRAERVYQERGDYVVVAGGRELSAPHVVVAMSNYQRARLPEFASQLRADIVQLHSSAYASPTQLRPGPVLIAGAGNSGSEIALELVRGHETVMSGRDTGHIPFRIAGFLGRLFLVHLVIRVLFHRLITVATPIGRRLRPKLLRGGGPLIRVKPRDLAARGVARAPKTVGVCDGLPLLEDGRVLEVSNVVWCTGYHPGFSFIERPIFDEHGEPRHEAGVVPGEPGLYFVGLHFLYSMSSGMVHGVGRDAERIVGVVARRLAADESRESGGASLPRVEPAWKTPTARA